MTILRILVKGTHAEHVCLLQDIQYNL